jgi:hypothetical protein
MGGQRAIGTCAPSGALNGRERQHGRMMRLPQTVQAASTQISGTIMRAWAAIVAVGLSLAVAPAPAQDFASRAIALIVLFPPGGSTVELPGRTHDNLPV